MAARLGAVLCVTLCIGTAQADDVLVVNKASQAMEIGLNGCAIRHGIKVNRLFNATTSYKNGIWTVRMWGTRDAEGPALRLLIDAKTGNELSCEMESDSDQTSTGQPNRDTHQSQLGH